MSTEEKELEKIWRDFNYGNSKFDEQSLYISSGALAISLSFVKDIVPLKESCCMLFFYLAILLFLTTIIFSYLGHRLSAVINYRLYKMTIEIQEAKKADPVNQENIDKLFEDRYNFQEEKAKEIESINKTVTITLVSGLASLVFYCIINIAVYKETFNCNCYSNKSYINIKN